MSRDALLDAVVGVDGLLCMITDHIDEELLNLAPDLKIVANFGVGYNNIDIEEAARRGVMVSNTPGVLTESTADLAMALLLAVGRRVVESTDTPVKGGFSSGRRFTFWGMRCTAPHLASWAWDALVKPWHAGSEGLT